jgi:hypothetical protein
VVLQPGHGVERSPSRRAAERHRLFHGALPRCARQMEWPTPDGTLRTLGLIESVTYVATGIGSPIKGAHRWVHQFGDRGELGHGVTRKQSASAYSERLMPELRTDSAGNLFVVRRSSNRYTVRDWIIG